MNSIHPLQFSKDTTLFIKGVLIMMMLWLHLFKPVDAAAYYSLCSIDGITIEFLITRACNPVGMFCFLSGYGVYYSYKKKRQNVIDCILGGGKKSLKLYLSLWILFLVFVPLCSLVDANKYPGPWQTIITNLLGYTNTWNGTVWFVLPFCLVMLTYGLWMGLLEKRKGIVLVLVSSLILYYGVALIYGRFWNQLQEQRYLLIGCRMIEVLTPFAIGAIAQRCSNYELRFKFSKTILQFIVLLLLVGGFVYSIFRGIPIYPVYSGWFCILLANIKIESHIGNIIRLLGKYSMVIWLTHTYYFEVLFRNEIYSLRYPLLIFIVTLLISTVVAILLDKLINVVTRKIIK